MLPLRRKTTAAATTPRRVRVLKYKTLAHERVFVLQNRAVQVEQTLRVHKNARTKLFKNFVTIACLRVQTHRVGQARTAAALHANAQTSYIRRHTFFGKQGDNLLSRKLTDVNLPGRRAPFALWFAWT